MLTGDVNIARLVSSAHYQSSGLLLTAAGIAVAALVNKLG